jgi:hypothetical protein
MQQKPFQLFKQLLSMALFAMTLLGTACEKDEVIDEPGSGLRLDYMEIKENALGGLLYLHGYFGDSTASAKVFVNGGEMTQTDSTYRGAIKSWTPWMVTCQIPPAKSQYGKGAVYVRNNNKSSNTRMLRAWSGDVLFHRPDQGSLEREIRMRVYLRADIDVPGSAVKLMPLSSFGVGSKALYKLGGQGTSTYNNDGSCMVTVIANLAPAEGEMLHLTPYTDRVGEPEYFQSEVVFQGDHFNVMNLDIFKEKVSTRTMTVNACGDPSDASFDYDLYGPPSELSTFNLHLDLASRTIKAGHILHRASTEMGLIWDNGAVPFYDCSLSWPMMKEME